MQTMLLEKRKEVGIREVVGCRDSLLIKIKQIQSIIRIPISFLQRFFVYFYFIAIIFNNMCSITVRQDIIFTLYNPVYFQAVLGAADDKNCTYDQGYMKRCVHICHVLPLLEKQNHHLKISVSFS